MRKKGRDMARMSISLPDNLKARMDEAGDQNWSALAQRAFDDEIQRLEWRRKQLEEINMDEVVERLRESKSSWLKRGREIGFEEGVSWAKAQATYAELKTVAEFDLDPDGTGLGFALASQLFGGPDEAEWYQVEDWWDKNIPDDARVIGFQEGAASIWEQVKDSI